MGHHDPSFPFIVCDLRFHLPLVKAKATPQMQVRSAHARDRHALVALGGSSEAEQTMTAGSHTTQQASSLGFVLASCVRRSMAPKGPCSKCTAHLQA